MLTLLTASMVLSVSGCGGDKNETAINTNDETLNLETAAPENYDLPIGEDLSFKVVTTLQPVVAGQNISFNDVAAFKEMEQVTGVKIDFQHITNEKRNLLFASNDLPDMFIINWENGSPMKYAQDGQIYKLDSLLSQYAPNFVNLLKENESIVPQIVEADNGIYYFPFLRNDPELRIFAGFQIRQDWLDKVNMEVPKTKEELYSVLKAFKENDMNGNGVDDEYPIITEKGKGLDYMLYWWGIGEFYVDSNDKIQCGWLQPEYKEYVTWLNQIYNEGLIDPDYAILDKNQFESKISNGQSGVWYGLAGGTLGRLSTLMASIDPNFKLTALPWLQASDGNSYVLNTEYISVNNTNLGLAITQQCSNVEAAVKWTDFAYSEQGNLLLNFGVEGESYEMKDGVPTYTDLITNNPNLSMSETLQQYCIPSGYPMNQNPYYFDQYMTPIQKDAINVWKQCDTSRTVPVLKYTQEEVPVATNKFNELKSYNNEMLNKFITGKESLDNFDSYIDTLTKMGINDVIAVQQSAYDRYKTLINN